MAIQLRRGSIEDFDKAKMVEGEIAICRDGSAYYCYMAGQVEKIMNERDLAAFLSVSQEQFDMLIQLLESTGEFEEFAELFITDTLNNYTVTVLEPLKTEMEGLLAEARALVGSALRFVATVTFANLPTLSESLIGNMYSISDSFTTDDRFVDGSGKKVEAGTNVAVVDVDGVYLFDVLATTTDLTPITNPTFTESTNFETINSQESLPTMFGKIKKWFGQITQNKNDIVQLNSNLGMEYAGAVKMELDTPIIATSDGMLAVGVGYRANEYSYARAKNANDVSNFTCLVSNPSIGSAGSSNSCIYVKKGQILEWYARSNLENNGEYCRYIPFI